MAARTILLVDVDVELGSMLSKYVRAEGFEVVPVSDGEKALNRLETGDPDLTILDVATTPATRSRRSRMFART